MFESKNIFKDSKSKNVKLFPLDILIDRDLTNEDLSAACADVFSIAEQEVVIVKDLSERVDIYENKIQLFCEKTLVSGDFQLLVSLLPQNSMLKEKVSRIGDELDIAQKLCQIWHSKCLIKDNSPIEEFEEDAYYLLKEGVKPQRVYVDLDKIDDDMYVIIS